LELIKSRIRVLEFSEKELDKESIKEKTIQWERQSDESVQVEVMETLQNYTNEIKKSLNESRMGVQENIDRIKTDIEKEMGNVRRFMSSNISRLTGGATPVPMN
jgi:gas vesicle protein